LFDLHDESFFVIPNGIDLEQFPKTKKVKNNLAWTSSYERGIIPILMAWPELQKEVPDITLDVAYGFEMYDKTPWGKIPSGQEWKRNVIKLLDQPGITHHGRLGTNEVAELYKKADVWAYPTGFPEIDCISATKAMAAKCVPITSDYAAMKERNQGVMIEGDIHDPTIERKFIHELIALLKDEDRKSQIREKLDVAQYSWDVIAQRWSEEMSS
jgi:glycosyltransferase involved in cell wall biosynthesis